MTRTLPAHLVGANVEEKILDTADRLLAIHGYRDLTMEKLADEVGFAKGTTYLYFSSKADVAMGVIDRSVLKVFDALEKIAASSRSAEARLKELLVARVLLRHRNVAHYDRRKLAELLDILGPRLRERRRESARKEIALFSTVIGEGVATGEFRPCDTDEIATAMFWASEGLLPSHIGSEDLGKVAIADRITSLSNLLVSGVSVQRSSHTVNAPRARRRSSRIGLRMLSIATLCATLSSRQAAAQAAGAPGPMQRLNPAKVDTIFAQFATDTTPGCAVGIDSASTPLLRRGYGMASLELSVHNSPGTVFYGASIAKQFTAAATLLLQHDGKLELSDPISKYIPELTGVGAHVTLEQLLAHTSGLRDYGELMVFGGHQNEPVDVRRIIDLLKRQRSLNFPSGTEFAYNNGGYVLLAEVVRRASGTPFPEFVRARIFEPLGMKHSRFVSNHFELVGNRAAGHRNNGKDWEVTPYVEDTFGDGGLFTTVDDLLLWGGNMQSGTAGGRELIERLTRETALPNGRSTGFGLGLEVSRYRGRAFVGHGGRSAGAQNYALTFPAEGISIAVLCNARDIDAELYARRIAGSIFPPLPPASVAVDTTTATVDARQLHAVEGIYLNPQTLAVRRVEVRDGKLVWVRGPGTVMRPQSSTKFRFPDLAGALVFSDFRDGTAQRMDIVPDVGDATSYQRVEPFTVPPRGLADYAGTYESDEVDGVYRVEVSNDALSFTSLNSSFEFAAFPAIKDGFKGGEDLLLIFERDRKGLVTGFTFNTSRARKVQFTKRPE